jgi:hypothetical protein
MIFFLFFLYSLLQNQRRANRFYPGERVGTSGSREVMQKGGRRE